MFRIFRALLILASWPMLAQAVDSHLIYLNNCKPNGCVVHPGNDNAVTHTSPIPNQQSTVTAFAFSDDTFGRTVGCLRAAFARYDVSITTVDPGPLPRREMMIAGSPQDIGMPGGTTGSRRSPGSRSTTRLPTPSRTRSATTPTGCVGRPRTSSVISMASTTSTTAPTSWPSPTAAASRRSPTSMRHAASSPTAPAHRAPPRRTVMRPCGS